MAESFKTKLFRLRFNLFPAYRGTGARITYIDASLREVRIRLPLNRRTRNYVGTIYGGSMYSAVDPIFMIMLIFNLGKDYVVWDKAASIRFLKPGRQTLSARFILSEEELSGIRSELNLAPSVDREYAVELVDAEGVVCARVTKTIYIRKKKPDTD